MKTQFLKLAAFTIMFMSLFAACKKENDHQTLHESASQVALDFLSCNHFNTDSAESVDGHLKVEGCIVFKESDLEEMANGKTLSNEDLMTNGHAEDRQYAYHKGSLIAMDRVNNIKFYIDPSITAINSGWKTAIEAACTQWTDIPSCRITFTKVNSNTSADLSFFADNNTTLPVCMRNISPLAGSAMFPANNNVGRYISILSTYNPDANTKLMIALHEIGHALGFRHDNSANENGNTPCMNLGASNKISGTPTSESTSVMVTPANSTNISLSVNDQLTAKYMYPQAYSNATIVSATSNGGTVTLNLAPLTSQFPYRLLIGRYNTSGYPVQVYEILNPQNQTSFQIACPPGTWQFKTQYYNYGTFCSALPAPFTTHVTGITSGAVYKLTHKGTNKCLDVVNNSSSPGANVQQFEDNGNNAQRWIVSMQADGHFKLTHLGTNQCLDVAYNSGNPGANVQQFTDNGNNAQRWKIEYQADGSYKLTHKGTNQCLEVAYNSNSNGANVQQFTDNGNDAQRWYFTKI